MAAAAAVFAAVEESDPLDDDAGVKSWIFRSARRTFRASTRRITTVGSSMSWLSSWWAPRIIPHPVLQLSSTLCAGCLLTSVHLSRLPAGNWQPANRHPKYSQVWCSGGESGFLVSQVAPASCTSYSANEDFPDHCPKSPDLSTGSFDRIYPGWLAYALPHRVTERQHTSGARYGSPKKLSRTSTPHPDGEEGCWYGTGEGADGLTCIVCGLRY